MARWFYKSAATNRGELQAKLEKAREKMVTAAANGSRTAWRKYGKQVYSLRKQLNLSIDPWMEEYFGRIDNGTDKKEVL